jgi:hypothetical protein
MTTQAIQPPKRYLNGYMIFNNEKRSQLQRENPTKKLTEISTLISRLWKTLTPEEHAKYKAISDKDKIKYEADFAVFKLNNPTWKPKKRKLSQTQTENKRQSEKKAHNEKKTHPEVRKTTSSKTVSKSTLVLGADDPEDGIELGDNDSVDSDENDSVEFNRNPEEVDEIIDNNYETSSGSESSSESSESSLGENQEPESASLHPIKKKRLNQPILTRNTKKMMHLKSGGKIKPLIQLSEEDEGEEDDEGEEEEVEKEDEKPK